MPVDDLIAERTGPAWVDKIRVLNVGTEGDTQWVELGCASWIAQEQASLSLSSFVENDDSDWDSAWKTVEGSDLPHRIRLVGLRADEYPTTQR